MAREVRVCVRAGCRADVWGFRVWCVEALGTSRTNSNKMNTNVRYFASCVAGGCVLLIKHVVGLMLKCDGVL